MSPQSASTKPAPTQPHLLGQALAETEAMLQYAMAQGIVIPTDVVDGVSSLRSEFSRAEEGPTLALLASCSRRQLGQRHQQLARLVAPATPRTLLLLADHSEKKGLLQMLGPVPLVRQMIAVALVFLLSLLGLSSHEEISTANIASGFFENQGFTQVYCQSFLLCAAGLGACFSALFEVNRHVERGVYDPKYDASYWSRLVLGLMAGIMLAELVGPQFFEGAAGPASGGGDTTGASPGAAFAKPTLAMIGGFSASLVHRIMEKLVSSIESLIANQADAALADKEESLKLQVSADAVAERLTVAGRLLRLQPSLDEAPQARAQLSQVLADLMSADGLSAEPVKPVTQDIPKDETADEAAAPSGTYQATDTAEPKPTVAAS